MNILLSFTGFHDPYSPSVVEQRQQAGPILSMIEALNIDAVELFDTPGTTDNTQRTITALAEQYPRMTVSVHHAEMLEDPTDHIGIMSFLRPLMHEILNAYPDEEFYISISSGTPSMHACWLLLVADGSIPARAVYGHPPRHAEEIYRVSEVDLESELIPEIVHREECSVCLESPSLYSLKEYVPDLQTTCDALGIIGTDHGFMTALDQAARVARYDAHVMVLGETGTGKEEVAKLIHRMSPRSGGPFVVVNCAAFPGELVESMLFGHKKGAFTGAVKDQTGEFDHAHAGTLFLDEIAEIPATSQSKLLRVLQDGRIKPIGAEHDHQVDVRIVAATNADLPKAVQDETFRLDLANRFAMRLTLPPLRQRPGDIIRLATYALERWNQRHGEHRRLAQSALSALQRYAWPGNVRELLTTVETAAMLARTNLIQESDLPMQNLLGTVAEPATTPALYEGFSLKDHLQLIRTDLIQTALAQCHGNASQAARLLGITPQAVSKFVKSEK